MSGLIVHGRATSSNVQVVMWAIDELGLDCERLDVGGAFGGTDTAEYRNLNPMGLVPVLQDGSVTLFESCAIVRYLAARYGDENIWPRDPSRRAELDQWAEWAKGTFAKTIIYEIFWTLVRTPKAQRNPDQLAVSVETAASLAKMLDSRLSDGPYLGGNHLSFADLIVGHILYRYNTLDFEKADTPALDAYYQRLVARSTYADHVMIDYSSLQVE